MKRLLLIFFGLCMICNVYAGDVESKEKSDINNDNKEGLNMAITVNLRYTGTGGNARAFAEEMMSSGTVDKIRAEKGNLRYEYYVSMEDPETVLLVDSWTDQEAIDAHHASPMMETIATLREKYDLHMTIERYVSKETPKSEERFIRK